MNLFIPLIWNIHPSVNVLCSWLWVPANITHAKQKEGSGGARGPLPNLEWGSAICLTQNAHALYRDKWIQRWHFFIAVDYYVTVDKLHLQF